MTVTKKTTLDASLNAGFSIPLNTYQGQYREITDRIRERHRRESDVDKFIGLRDKYKEKNDARYNATEQRVATATLSYEDLNKELIDDIPKLIADSQNFFTPLIYQLIFNQALFWQGMSQHAAALAATLDKSQAHVPPMAQVITPKQTSSMTRKYAAAANPWAADIGAKPGANPWGPPAIEAATPTGPAPTAYAPPAQSQPVPLPARPRPVPPPSRGVQAKGVWEFNGADSTELSFKAGDIINIVEQNGDWWTGEMAGRRGLLPANYVQLI